MFCNALSIEKGLEPFYIVNNGKISWIKGEYADLPPFIENLDFDQLILEYHKPEEPNSGWIHCSYKSPTDNRKQTLRAFRNDQGKTQYVEYNPN